MIDLLMMARIFFTRNVVFVFALPSRHFSNGPSLILNNTSKIVALKKKEDFSYYPFVDIFNARAGV